MINYPKITIITPSFNQGMYIEQTILSVLNQNYPNLEYIIIDGGSNDNTLEIIKKYASRLSYWVSEPDKGQSDAINKGLKIASGEIINWLNSDDYYEPNALFTIAKAFKENTNAKVVCARSRLFRNENETVAYTKGTDVYPENLAKTIGWARIDQPETFFHRSAIEKMGILDTELNYLMDRDWWIKYLFIFGLDNIVQIPEVIVNFRLHKTSKTISQKEKFQIEHDSLFYSLSTKNYNSKYTKIISENFIINEKFELKKSLIADKNLITIVLNYFLLFRANESYALNQKNKTKSLLKAINLKYLKKADKYLWYKINFRNRYIPQSIIKIFRK